MDGGSDDLPWVFTERLERENLDYMIVGAYATIAFGAPRTTEDIDLVLAISLRDIARFEHAFPAGEFYCPPRETLVTEISRSERGHFNLVHNASLNRADCYLIGRDPLQHWGLRNLHTIQTDGRRCKVAPPEVVILKKLEYFREGGSRKHKHDIQTMLKITDVDRAFVEAQVERLGLREQWLVCQPADS